MVIDLMDDDALEKVRADWDGTMILSRAVNANLLEVVERLLSRLSANGIMEKDMVTRKTPLELAEMKGFTVIAQKIREAHARN